MEAKYKNPKIYLIAGHARHGKDTIAGYLKEFYELDNKKVIFSPYAKYIKFYAKEMSDWDGREETKPRKLLQELGTDIIRQKLNKAEMFIDRQKDDIEIYSYFFDAIMVPDIRLPREIDGLKEKFKNIVTIKVKRINFETELTDQEQKHITEIAIDEYPESKFDYVITNDTLEKLKEEVYTIYKKEADHNEKNDK